MNTKQMYYVGGALAIILVAIGGFFAYRAFSEPMSDFSNAEYGISFTYPAHYSVDEQHFADRHTIILADKDALAATPQNGEGPTTITLDVFQNPRDLSPSDWVKSNSASNFQLSNGALASTTQAGAEAVAYVWDGLYRGESYVFENGDEIVMLTVTMMEPTDAIHNDFEKVMRSLQLK